MVLMPHWPKPLLHRQINLGLERTQLLLEALGNPHLKLPPIIHIAGTNGKGSTQAYLRAIFEASNMTVHCYTSPHLLKFNERIVVGSAEISDAKLYNYLEQTRIASEKLDLDVTFFEGTTIAAFLAFAECRADIVLLEVGIGGRLDATNVIACPLASVITPISFDHVAYPGDTIAKIAYEKAGIMKENSLCITSIQSDEAQQVFIEKAEELNIALFAYEYDYIIEKTSSGFKYLSKDKSLTLPALSLIGEHQYLNAATAIATIVNLPNFNITDQAIIQGITSAKWPARLERINQGKIFAKLPLGWELWVDGAHNDAGAKILSLWAEDKQEMPLYLIAGMTKGRDSASFFKQLVGKVNYVCGVLVEGEPSSHPASYIENSAKQAGIEAIASSSILQAIEHLLFLKSSPARILICGSLYLAADAIRLNNTH